MKTTPSPYFNAEREATTLAGKASSAQLSNSLASWLRMLFATRVVETISVALLLSLVLSSVTGWSIWSTYRGFRETVTKQFRLQRLSDRTAYLDEVLTMSAYMAASTGDIKWVGRYHRFEPELTKVIEEIIQTSPTAKTDFNQTKIANDKLVEHETRSFELLGQGQKQDAANILFGKDYATQKQIYTQGVEKTLNHLQTATDAQLQAYTQRLFWSVVFAGISLPLLMVSWAIILSAVRTYIQERKQAQEDLLSSQTSLRQLNEELEQRTQQLTVQEQATRQESEVLQADVQNLLDVVSAVEKGDLTAQAPMSDRVTGLVADTLNRLIEELARIIFEVQSQAQQTAHNATDVEKLAVATVQQAQQQAQSVSEVKSLMANVTNLSQGATQQALAADEAVQQAQAAVVQGQQEMETMTAGIVTLQQGTDQIIRRVQTLTDFVKLAAQFAQGQKRVATMTRVLALNASTLVARAVGQEDPEQFASIAREFETIANQVNELATQTSQSLILLQQRTDQIQTVVSGLNRDVQEIGALVVNLTGGVEQSRQAFDNITTVTERVAQVGQQVSQSSQAIVEAAQTTLRSIQDIATAADTTEQQARFTLGQSEAVGQAAYTLLELVRFFRLSAEQNQDGLARGERQANAIRSNGGQSTSTLPMLTGASIKSINA